MAGKQASAIQQILQLVHVSHLSPTRHTRLGSQSVTYHNDLFGAKTYTQLGKCEEEEEEEVGRKNSWDRFRSTAHLATAWLDYCHPMMGPDGQHHVLFTLSLPDSSVRSVHVPHLLGYQMVQASGMECTVLAGTLSVR